MAFLRATRTLPDTPDYQLENMSFKSQSSNYDGLWKQCARKLYFFQFGSFGILPLLAKCRLSSFIFYVGFMGFYAYFEMENGACTLKLRSKNRARQNGLENLMILNPNCIQIFPWIRTSLAPWIFRPSGCKIRASQSFETWFRQFLYDKAEYK